ncbi:TPA: hypothetical protein PCH53_001876 [Klebsiella pneumoniae]|uniref:hypothetical protein n=1 Tax=Klebsiella pneumoniae TaxID=573 RepID=UPI0021B78F7F|nr:hypothetical protein [Klebsiella pneumoniae]EIV5328796.1 hypothetical protein [Klebsiella pneumoniae]HBQ1382779.1 hypothetical protein [Klebsiella pneumoniae]HDE0974696.1 hypothetical protein [Klebsiella pneumoniae]HDE0980521.1 hypothetical protein [Klebsiella pneumoniae]HDE0996609.1 hypothetical protein [Klebsiella pneumoniae]
MAITDTQQASQFAASAAVSAAEAKQYALSIEKPIIDISESVTEAKNAAAASELARDEAKDIASGLSSSIDFELAEKEAEFESQMQGQRTAFEVSQQDKESDFLSSQSQREADFVESQTDRENRFQTFLDSSGYVFLGDYENGPFQFSARNQYIRYNNQYYRLNAATDVGFTTTGTDATSFANDVTHFVLMDGDTLRQELKNTSNPGELIGNFFSGEGEESVGDANQSVWERIFKRGEFEIHQMPGDPAGVAGIVFGGPNNKAAVVIDERGRIQTYAVVDGKLSAAQVGTPIVQGTGYFNNGFEDKIVRFPSAGGESDDLTPGILITTNDNGICDFFVVSPNQFNDLGYPTSSSMDKQMFKLVKSFDIGTSLQRTIDQYPTVENSSPVLYRLFDVNYSGYGSKVVSGILSVGNYVNYTSNVYMVTFNPQALGNAPIIDQGSIYQWLKVTALHGGQSGWGDSALTPAVGLVNDPNNTMAKIFLRLPAYGQRISFTPINVANPNVVTFYYSDLRNNVTVDTPNYLVYSFAEKMATDRFYVKMNNGDVRYSPGTVVRVSGNVTDRLSDKLSDGVFAIGGAYHLANKGRATSITVTNPSTGQYVISGCNLRGDHWKVCPPVGFSGTSFGTPPYTVSIVSQGTNTFTIEVKTAAGSLVNINGFDWLDLHVQPA